MEATGI